MSALFKSIYRFNTILVKISAGYLVVKIDKLTLKFVCKFKEPRITKNKTKKLDKEEPIWRSLTT